MDTRTAKRTRDYMESESVEIVENNVETEETGIVFSAFLNVGPMA